jgi:hypothetical protein
VQPLRLVPGEMRDGGPDRPPIGAGGPPAATFRISFGALGLPTRSMALSRIPGRGDALKGPAS